MYKKDKIDIFLVVINKQALKIKLIQMPKRQYSLKVDRQFRELEHYKQKLNDHLRIVNNTQHSFHPESPEHYFVLPTVRQEKIKIKADRYTSEKEKYQNNLRTVLVEIRKKMEESTYVEVKSLKAKSNRKPQSLSPLKRQNLDFKIKGIDLSPEPKIKTISMGRSLQNPHKTKVQKKQQRQRYGNDISDRFVFEPWYEKEDMQFYTLDK